MEFKQAILASRLGLYVQRDDWDPNYERDWITNIYEGDNGFMASTDAYGTLYEFPKSVAMEHQWRLRDEL